MDRDRVAIQVAGGQWAQRAMSGPNGDVDVRYTTDWNNNDRRFVLINLTNPGGCLRVNDRVAFFADNGQMMRDDGEWVMLDRNWVGDHEQWHVKGTVLSP